MSGLELVIGLGAMVLVIVFAIAFRYGLRQVAGAQRQASVPRAVVIAGDARWMEGSGRQRWLDRIPTFQAALVALAITSVFVMGACFLAIVAVVAVGH